MDRYEPSDFDLADFLPDVAKQFCPQCGGAVLQKGRGRPRIFCSAACSRLWWNSHHKPEHWKSARMVACEFCGREFLSKKDLYRPRKYCSRSCANRARTGRKKTDLEQTIQTQTEKGGDVHG